MPAIVLVGAQWGDEGKGKATDLLGDRVDYVVRYQGGNNAGHTVVIGDESYALHMLPSGVLSPSVVPVIGNGVVIDPQVLLGEIDDLAARGIDCGKLLVSANAHLIMPYHRALDVPIDYMGLTCPDEFVVGYGLDYQERYRTLPYLAKLRPEVLPA